MTRTFLFLQGPHGPFFRELAGALRAEGALTLKVGFNRADDREWRGAGLYLPYGGTGDDWPVWLARLIEERRVTDIALYGDTRPRHAAALAVARARGLMTHVFEEGYLRPYWVTYERGGANGDSRLMRIGLDPMRVAALTAGPEDGGPAPPVWGAAWRHALHGLLYHYRLLLPGGRYPGHEPHRPAGPWREAGLHLRRLLSHPLQAPVSRWRRLRLWWRDAPYHLVLLQLSADESLRRHGPYASVGDFVDEALDAFARAAPPGEMIVFKTHPFEDGRERLEARARRAARRLGLSRRMVFLHGGRLGPLLDRARAAVTVNSTAGQQALWRGLPLLALGRAVYSKPGLATAGDMAAFFARPAPPDAEAYRAFRRFLLMSSQVRGGFYTKKGRRGAVERIARMMFDPLDPYDRAFGVAAAAGGNVALLRPSAPAETRAAAVGAE